MRGQALQIYARTPHIYASYVRSTVTRQDKTNFKNSTKYINKSNVATRIDSFDARRGRCVGERLRAQIGLASRIGAGRRALPTRARRAAQRAASHGQSPLRPGARGQSVSGPHCRVRRDAQGPHWARRRGGERGLTPPRRSNCTPTKTA